MNPYEAPQTVGTKNVPAASKPFLRGRTPNGLGFTLTLFEHLTFLWIGLFGLFVWHDKTIWYIPQSITSVLSFLVYLIWLWRERWNSPLLLPMLCGGVAMAALWYELPLSSIADSTGPIMIFTLPVLLIWSLRNICCFSCRSWSMGLLWVVVLVIGGAIFLPMSPVRKTYAWNQDPDATRHSLRAAIAVITMLLSAGCIIVDRLVHLNRTRNSQSQTEG